MHLGGRARVTDMMDEQRWSRTHFWNPETTWPSKAILKGFVPDDSVSKNEKLRAPAYSQLAQTYWLLQVSALQKHLIET